VVDELNDWYMAGDKGCLMGGSYIKSYRGSINFVKIEISISVIIKPNEEVCGKIIKAVIKYDRSGASH
jgi:hypothetical protein